MSTVPRDPALLNVTAESLVRWAGGFEDTAPHAEILSMQLGIAQSMPQASQNIIYCEVIAKYMPALADVWRRATEAVTPAGTLINAASTTPYFVRFLRSPDGADIAAIQAQRVAAAVDRVPSMPLDHIAELGQFLSTLFLLQGTQGVSAEDKSILVQHLPQWERRYDGVLAGETAGRCLALLTDDRNMRPMMDMVRNMLESKMDKCGGPGCTRRVQKDGAVLQQCGRCKSAVYCGTPHQKAAWPAHKSTCFTPAF
ncbi:hypothetical protein FB45DRAFT_930568 [Roridomyces roridus]|uniref:MYND-type domain-containing protein n=1 Tax=Roridomyces roridus TaxID=1738132 RepID=A0AAD7FEH4_9AGAR|nr:hypothetical protein FB45DRAFT_930568 [Roridomyces roridus]